MKTTLVLSVLVVLAAFLALAVALATPDYAVPARRALDGEPCAALVYFAGPVAVEDRRDCGQSVALTVR